MALKDVFTTLDLITYLLKEFGKNPFTPVKFNISSKKGIPFTDAIKDHFKNSNGFLLIDVKSILKEKKDERIHS